MSNVYRANRKASDKDIIRLNSVGLSLTTIGEKLGVNGSTITQRLKAMNVQPADTRRSFMEDIYETMPRDQQAWLEGQVAPYSSVKDYVRHLLTREFLNTHYTGAPKS